MLRNSITYWLNRLIDVWYKQDRIRISPRAGRLLRLEPGALIAVGGQTAEVCARTVGCTAGGSFVTYECSTTIGPGTLHVLLYNPTPNATVRWMVRGREQMLSEEAVEVFGKWERANAECA